MILLDEKRETEERFDDALKTANLPYWQFEALASQNTAKKPPAKFADAVIPASLSVRQAQARIEQRIALLRHVEALRLYAAEHNGTLPVKLADISVPLPVDPITGKPFRYELTNSKAHLRGNPPSGQKENRFFNVHYEVTLQK